MTRIITIAFVAAALASAGMALPVHALTPAQSAALAAKARAEALTRTRAQAAAKARADFLAKSRADAAAKSKSVVTTTRSIQLEILRRTEAAEKAAHAQAQIKTANIQPQPLKTGSIPRSAQVPKISAAQPAHGLRSATPPQHSSGPKPYSSMSRATTQTSRSPTHTR